MKFYTLPSTLIVPGTVCKPYHKKICKQWDSYKIDNLHAIHRKFMGDIKENMSFFYISQHPECYTKSGDEARLQKYVSRTFISPGSQEHFAFHTLYHIYMYTCIYVCVCVWVVYVYVYVYVYAYIYIYAIVTIYAITYYSQSISMADSVLSCLQLQPFIGLGIPKLWHLISYWWFYRRLQYCSNGMVLSRLDGVSTSIIVWYYGFVFDSCLHTINPRNMPSGLWFFVVEI